MKVAVAYAEAKKQVVLEVEVDEGISAVAAIERSGILAKIPPIDLAEAKIGIFGKIIKPEHIILSGDRLEIYRPALGKPPKKDRSVKEEDDEE